jgi:uncharacterized membrane protein
MIALVLFTGILSAVLAVNFSRRAVWCILLPITLLTFAIAMMWLESRDVICLSMDGTTRMCGLTPAKVKDIKDALPFLMTLIVAHIGTAVVGFFILRFIRRCVRSLENRIETTGRRSR